MRTPSLRTALVALLGMTACNAYDGDLGPTPFLCGAEEPRCPNGYACLEENGREVCFEDGSQSGDASCGDDDGLEPNDAVDAATPTPLDDEPTFALQGLTICPAVDRDNFAVTLSATNGGIEVVVAAPETAMLRAAILNQAGIPITTSSMVAGTPPAIRAQTQNLPAGTYVVQVAGSEGTGPDAAYDVTITVTAP